MLLAIAIPPLRTFMGGWTNFVVNEESRLELIMEYFVDPVRAFLQQDEHVCTVNALLHCIVRLRVVVCVEQAQYFLFATASVIFMVWLSHRDGYVKLSAFELATANWYLLCGAYIHFLMDGLVGCYGAWGLMRRAYETLDGRFPRPIDALNQSHYDLSQTPLAVMHAKSFEAHGAAVATPDVSVRQAIPNWSVPYVVGHMEMIVYFPLCLALYYGYKRGESWRRPLEILVASFQLFGAIVFMGSEEVLDSPNLFIRGRITGSGRIPDDAPWFDVACFYWFAYFFCNLIWVFVPIPLIFKAMSEISEGIVVTNMPFVTAEGMLLDVISADHIEALHEDATLELLGEDADGSLTMLVSGHYDKED